MRVLKHVGSLGRPAVCGRSSIEAKPPTITSLDRGHLGYGMGRRDNRRLTRRRNRPDESNQPKERNMSVEEILGTHRRPLIADVATLAACIDECAECAASGSASIAPTRALTPGASSAARPTLTRTRSSRRLRHA
jgi:hypothetical protein